MSGKLVPLYGFVQGDALGVGRLGGPEDDPADRQKRGP